MRVWLLSDLHLEMSVWDLPKNPPAFDVLVVADDLVTRAERGVAWLRERVVNKDAIYVTGNHERYGTDFHATVELARAEAVGSRIHVLENDAVIVGGVEFVACTFWTDFALFGDDTVDGAMKVVEARMNNYRAIRIDGATRKLRAEDTLRAHRDSVAFLRDHCAKDPNRRCVICTHYSVDPTALPRLLERDLVGAAYSSRLLGLVEELHPKAWVSGHIHHARQRIVGGTHLIANAKGCGSFSVATPGAWQNRSFDPFFTFEV